MGFDRGRKRRVWLTGWLAATWLTMSAAAVLAQPASAPVAKSSTTTATDGKAGSPAGTPASKPSAPPSEPTNTVEHEEEEFRPYVPGVAPDGGPTRSAIIAFFVAMAVGTVFALWRSRNDPHRE